MRNLWKRSISKYSKSITSWEHFSTVALQACLITVLFFFFFFFWQITLKRFVKILELEIQKNLFQWQGFSNELFSQFLTNCFSLPILSEFKLINFQEKRSQLNSLNSPKIRPQIWRRSPFAPLLIKRFNSKIKNTNSAVSLFTALIEEDTDV